MQALWRRYEKKLLKDSCEFLLWFDDKYHANILCQCILAVFPKRPVKRIIERTKMRLILY
jgi:hypothetical protein